MINSHKVTKHACTSSWLPLAHSKHHTYHQVTVMNKQQKKQRLSITHIYLYIYIYIHISCKCDTNRAGHFTLDAHASRPVACPLLWAWHLELVVRSCHNDHDYVTCPFRVDIKCREISRRLVDHFEWRHPIHTNAMGNYWYTDIAWLTHWPLGDFN